MQMFWVDSYDLYDRTEMHACHMVWQNIVEFVFAKLSYLSRMSGSTVKLDFPNNDKDGNNSPSKVLAYWPASHVPVNPKFSFDKTTNKRNPTIVAQDHIQFKSDEELFSDDNYNYFIGSLSEDGKRMKCQTSKLYRMMPCYDFKDHEDSLKKGDSTLTKKEQLDEMKEKFGSRRSQRDLCKFFSLIHSLDA